MEHTTGVYKERARAAQKGLLPTRIMAKDYAELVHEIERLQDQEIGLRADLGRARAEVATLREDLQDAFTHISEQNQQMSRLG